MTIIRRVAAATIAAALSAGALSAVAAPAQADDPAPNYYVSLGDSLAAGYQPGGAARISYTDNLYEQLSEVDPNLEHVKLGCDGATTATMVAGPGCVDTYAAYDATTQLGAAVNFIEDHPGQVTHVTLNIGANDITKCIDTTTLGVDLTCIGTQLSTIAKNTATIESALRKAGGATPRYTAMTYYNPFLAAYLQGGDGRTLADSSILLAKQLAKLITDVNTTYGFNTADVAGAFKSNDQTLVPFPPFGDVPTNVVTICALTWMCAAQDIHANADGHQLIAQMFAAQLAKPQLKPTPPAPPKPPKPPVTKPKPVVKVKTKTHVKLVGKHRISKKKRVRLRVRVTAKKGGKIRGRLVIRDGKRRLKVVKVGKTGKRVVKLPRLKRKGKHRIFVLYKGSPTTKSSRSNRVRVVVKR